MVGKSKACTGQRREREIWWRCEVGGYKGENGMEIFAREWFQKIFSKVFAEGEGLRWSTKKDPRF
jgi:hypothetical protein